ncbi:intercellular adhesion molecule 1-like isoform X2 [Candoia aspera]|uniref:intercellular adhesion molecule 1-like isoform X2 n=1 Tax=Candoia aspera TaxID=51853 RepID=UPI002FD7BCC9
MAVRTWKLFTPFLCCIGFLLALSRAQKEDLPARLTEAVVEFGHFFVLNCSSIHSSSSNCDIQEESSLRYDYREDGPTWKAFSFILSTWTLHALCFVNCTDGKIRYDKTIVTVYQPPKSIEMVPVPEMEVGKPYNLTCWVSGVAPIRNLTVTLLKGAEQLLVKTFENHTEPEAGPVVVSHRIIAQQSDHNKRVTCQTSLDLRPRGPFLKSTSHNISLRIFKPLEQLTLELQKPSPGQPWAYNLICHVIRNPIWLSL